ncbi:MAG: hypothetical protein BWY72_02497 [Bacteroidetes bacterium ADurb.Bin416]|nr:MAG: hypothetical protein BWY72_02497 [Bacteroidetes bacterium ADurb.Bin416]
MASTLTTQTWNELGVSKTGTATLPTASNVKTGSGTYGVGGTGSTPSLTVPSLANTKIGVAGDGGTGTYDGSDRWTDPGEGNVRLSTAYKANSTSNNKTGTVVVPTAGNTKIGASTDVSGIGTYDGSDRWSDPGVSNVKNGTTYKANSTSDNRTGSLVSTDPGEQNVVEDVEYIIENVSHVGGFSVAESTDPGPENVLDGIQYIINDVPRVGTFDPNLNFESLRQFLNDILREIGSVSLTDEEYATIDLPDEYVYNSDVYNELDQVLLSRGDLNNDRAQLEYFFLARGVVLEPPEETVEIKSQILMGVAIDGAPSESTGKSNLFLGGPLE